MPTFGSLFAGIGGIDLGLERAGWECRWQVEWDAYCQRVLAKHWPDVPRYGDITGVDWSGVERVDLIAGGFPCQPFSLAGQRRGKSDDRWLWPAFAASIRALRPRYVLVENVPGLLAGHGGMGSILGDLAELGYDAEWDSVPAASVGAPHLRYRVWIVAYASQRPGFRVLPQPGEWPVPLGNGRGDAAFPDPDSARLERRGGDRGEVGQGSDEWPAGASGALPDASGNGRGQRRARRPDSGGQGQPQPALPTLADSRGERLQAGGPSRGVGVPTVEPQEHDEPIAERSDRAVGDWWSVEPNVGRVAHGVPARVDRLRALGNAVVPQVVEVIGRQLLQDLSA